MESGIVQWISVEARDREIQVLFPAPAVISDLVVVCHSFQPGPCGTGLKTYEVHCVFAHPTCSLKIPFAPSQRVAIFGGMGMRCGLSTTAKAVL